MANFWQDLRFAFRALGKSPWFAAIAIVTLSLGIAVNTCIFSMVNGFLLRPMPVPHPEQIAVLALQQAGDKSFQSFSYPDYLDLRAQSASFSDVIAYRLTLGGLTADNRGDHCIATRVTGNYFSVLGVQPALGRLILPTEGQTPGADPILVLGYSYWQKRFAGDSNVIGKSVEMNGHSLTIVGVAPQGFHGTYFIVASDLYLPFNVTNVLLVRATTRQREMAIRAALGAGRVRLVRQYLTESLLLTLLGAGGGMLLAYWAMRFLSSIPLGTDLPIQLKFLPDARVYFFALGAALVTGIIVGVFPALRVALRDVSSVLHDGARGASGGRRPQIVRGTLVVAQVAGSLVLLIVAGLFIRSLGNAENIYLGFSPANVLDFSLDVQQIGYQEVQGRAFYRELESRLRALPGVVSVGQAFSVPMGVMSAFDPVNVEGHPVEPGKQPPSVQYSMVTPGL